MDKSKALELLRTQLTNLREFRYQEVSPDFDKWRRDTRVVLEQVFGRDSRQAKEFEGVPFRSGVITADKSRRLALNTDGFNTGKSRAVSLLESIISEVDQFYDVPSGDATLISGESGKRPQNVRTEGPIFIGHGQSSVWKDLKDLLVDRLGLQYEEFNREPAAGVSTKERLLEILDRCCFAFLVMTAEDEAPDGTKRARQNVIHEAGLFQGRYGFERAIILWEEGCQEFSNIHGLGQIRFPKGSIKAQSEEIRRVLEREGILKKS
jgi:hypothetical protein